MTSSVPKTSMSNTFVMELLFKKAPCARPERHMRLYVRARQSGRWRFFMGRLRERAVCKSAGGAARSRAVHPQVVKLSFQGWEVTDTGVVTHVSEHYLQLERPTSDHLHLLLHNNVHLQEVLCTRNPLGGSKALCMALKENYTLERKHLFADVASNGFTPVCITMSIMWNECGVFSEPFLFSPLWPAVRCLQQWSRVTKFTIQIYLKQN